MTVAQSVVLPDNQWEGRKVDMCGIVGFNWQDEKLLRRMMAVVE
ncbi:unnamed protein product, partial [marine sediment metagenome]